jgi:hypothetical protein
MCVHGDDPEFRVAAGGHGPGAGTPRLAIPCHGDGTSGNRIALYYLYLAGHPDNITRVRTQIITAIEQANDIVYESARQTGGARWLRVLTNSRCTPLVRDVQVPASAGTDFARTIAAATRAGLDAGNRKYVLFVDTSHYCGLGTLYDDDQPGVMNANNAGPSWARIDSECWSGPATAHEIMHMIGSVQHSAPHYDGTGHCTDDHDLMCYQNQGGKRVYIRCSTASEELRLDCGKDDYFNTDPRAGSYLSRHWDTARSSFLYGGGPARPLPPRLVAAPAATMISLSSATLRWSPPARSRVTGYTVIKNGQVVWHGTRTNWTDTHAQAYAGGYQVQAVNEAGPGPWSSPANAALPPPAAPTAVTASSGSGTTTIAWTANPTPTAGYRLYGLPDGRSPRYLSDWPASARQGTDNTPWLLKHWHRYRVCAYNNAGTACRDQSGP